MERLAGQCAEGEIVFRILGQVRWQALVEGRGKGRKVTRERMDIFLAKDIAPSKVSERRLGSGDMWEGRGKGLRVWTLRGQWIFQVVLFTLVSETSVLASEAHILKL